METLSNTPMEGSPIGQLKVALRGICIPGQEYDRAKAIYLSRAGQKQFNDDFGTLTSYEIDRVMGKVTTVQDAVSCITRENEALQPTDVAEDKKRRNTRTDEIAPVGVNTPTAISLEMAPEIVSPEATETIVVISTAARPGRKRYFGTDQERKDAHKALQKENASVVLPPTPKGVRNAAPRSKTSKRIDKVRKHVLINRQDNKCFFCSRQFGAWIRKGSDGVPQQLRTEEEHFIPKGEPGSRKDENLHAACQICNMIKRRKVGFASIEECKAWLKSAWDLNGYQELGQELEMKQVFEKGTYERTAA